MEYLYNIKDKNDMICSLPYMNLALNMAALQYNKVYFNTTMNKIYVGFHRMYCIELTRGSQEPVSLTWLIKTIRQQWYTIEIYILNTYYGIFVQHKR
jgi:hypothetical protein